MDIRELRDFCLQILRDDPKRFLGDELAVIRPVEAGEGFETFPARGPSIELNFGSQTGVMFHLSNLYQDLTNEGDFSGERVEHALEVFFATMREHVALVDASYEEIRHRLRVIVDMDTYLKKDILAFPWGDMVIIPVVDADNSVRRVTKKDAERWDVFIPELVHEAIKQTRDALNGAHLVSNRVPPNLRWKLPLVTLVTMRDQTYLGSMLLFPSLLDRVDLQFGDYVGFPHRASLVVVKAPLDERAQQYVHLGIQLTHAREPWRRSPHLYQYTPDGLKKVR